MSKDITLTYLEQDIVKKALKRYIYDRAEYAEENNYDSRFKQNAKMEVEKSLDILAKIVK